ncbi:hypothetical protein BaRGS_00022520 [Batillaria attramentaria]|uniref:Uncharacterized protein n=1 Tax=Batillaria attramentaria TaxID=370345 RepID=A0ABD0KGN4_9CAEN
MIGHHFQQLMERVLLPLLGILYYTGWCCGNDDEYRLVRDLMARYNKQIRPALKSSDALNVSFGAALAQIIDVDEKNQIITTNLWINQGWIDPKLRWEPAKYGNVSVIRIPYDSLWLPDIVLYNSAHITSESVSTNVIVTAGGNVTWLSMVIVKSSCDIDVKYFPFDTQNCALQFSSWTYDAYALNLLIMGDEQGDLSNYMNSTEWHLIAYRQERQVVYFSCCEEPYIFIKNYIMMRRRPLFYVFNMVVPCLLITLVALLGFYMPSDSGEKISMGITTLLSMTVFLMIVADKMPPTSDDLPLIGLYYGITIAIVSFATAMTVFTLNIHHKGARGHEVPGIIKKIFFGIVAKVLFIHADVDEAQPPKKGMQPVPQNDYYARYEADKLPENGGLSPRFTRKFTPNTMAGGGTPDSTERQFLRVLQKVYQTIEKNEMRLADQDRRDTIRQEWQHLALILDRLLLVCFVILTTSVSLALILPGYSSQTDDVNI